MSKVKVDSIEAVNASTPAITLNSTDGTCTANITNNLSNRNLIINGAMQVAQRGTSTTSDGYKFLDRWQTSAGSIGGVTVTRSQQSLSSSDTPFQTGFRKYARIALGAAGTMAAGSYVDFYHHIEAQNVANSGWNYQSASSFITVSFWLRVSTNQTFYLLLRSRDGTNQAYVIPITASGDNVWTKITKTVPGNSNIVINDDNGTGFTVAFLIAYGTDSTDNSRAVNTWAAHSGSTLSPDMASTWLTAGASTFDVTGMQLEVGSVATDFEHKTLGQELKLCSRYYQQWAAITSGSSNDNAVAVMANFSSTAAYGRIPFINGPMRTGPSITQSNNSYFTNGASYSGLTYTVSGASPTSLEVSVTASSGNWTGGDAGWLRTQTGSGGQFALNAEL